MISAVKKGLLGAALAMSCGLAHAQSCDNPIPICGDIPEPLSLSFAQSLNVACVNSPYVSVLEFMTNGNLVNTGNATVEVGGVAEVVNFVAHFVMPPGAIAASRTYQAVSTVNVDRSVAVGASKFMLKNLCPQPLLNHGFVKKRIDILRQVLLGVVCNHCPAPLALVSFRCPF